MRKRHLSASQALGLIQSKRPHARPIDHFLRALDMYDKTLAASRST